MKSLKMMRQLILPTTELPFTLQDQIFTFLRPTWPEGFIEKDQAGDWLSHQENHPILLVLVDDSCLISLAAVVWKYLKHAGATFKAIDPRRSGQASSCPTSTSPDGPGIAGSFLLRNSSDYLGSI